jgi:spore germination cell wall hydrolase CwlJ-like protein
MDQATANNLTTVKMNPLGTGSHTSWFNAATGVIEPASDGMITAYIGMSTTGVTVNANTGDVAKIAHENRQPSRALYYIQRIA